MSELVSILIPAYNAEPWIGDTIQSCLNQTWPHVEVIVVDDGSRDGTLSVARSFASNKSVKVVSQPNSGAPVARNRALSLAQGSYLQWMDADDLLHPGKIAYQMQAAREVGPKILLSCPYGTFYHRPDKAVFVRTSLWRDLEPIDYFLTRFNENLSFQTDAWLVSRELTEATGTWSDVGSPDDDGEYFCRVMTKSPGIKFVEQARSYYRIGVAGGLHARRSKRALEALFQSKVKCINYLMSLEDSPRTREASVRLLQDWMPYFDPEHPHIVEQARQLARTLGGDVSRPRLKWKYRPVELLFGYQAGVRVSRILPGVKAQLACNWDGLLHRLMRNEVPHAS